MIFKLDHRRIEELVQLEEQVNCDIGAGTKLNPSLGQQSISSCNYIDDYKLNALLQDELNGLLSEGEIAALANDLQDQIRRRITQRQSP